MAHTPPVHHRLVPDFILEQYLAGWRQGVLPGAGMFVDLSGFSAMSDTLARQGYAGSEVLAGVMQVVFEPLVAAVYQYGGFVVGYVGDAVSAVFPEKPGAPAAVRCLAAAEKIRAHFAEHASIHTAMGDFSISVKIGLTLGESIWEIFHSADQKRATYCFRGPGMDQAAQAEHQSAPGEVWLDSALLAAVAQVVTVSERNGYYRLEACHLDLPVEAAAELPPLQRAALEAFFPPQILALTVRGEFRPMVNVFIDIPETAQQTTALQDFMQHIFVLQALYGGFFLRIDFGDKGCNLLLFWGAPQAHENDIPRALNFLLDLQRESGVLFSAGVSYRMAYAGFIGARQREDYTGYGWGISLAARMMKSAQPGEIWVDGEVASRAGREFSFGNPHERKFKGFSAPQAVYLLEGRRASGSQAYRQPFQGREEELSRLVAFLAPLQAGQPTGACLVTGEAGIGKSRLLDELLQQPQLAGCRRAFCQADGILREAFNPVRYWLRNRFQISDEQTDAQNLALLQEQLEALARLTPDPELQQELRRTTPFLAALLNLYWPNSLYQQLDAPARYENTLLALEALFLAESLQAPLVIVLEDAHLLDSDSQAFFARLMQASRAGPARAFPLALLATSRPEGEFPLEVDLHLALGGLEVGALSRLAENALGGPASADLLALLRQRAESNPFFAEQILYYLQENEYLQPGPDGYILPAGREQDVLSTDIQSVLVARLDRLTREVREIVLAAAVLGREFEMRLLQAMLRTTAVQDAVETAAAEEIWQPLSEIRYIFRHGLMRDAAYSMQLRARQRELHALACESLETLYRHDLDSHYGELAYHAEQAGLQPAALRYLQLAASQARDAHQLTQAQAYIQRGLALLTSRDGEAHFALLRLQNGVLASLGEAERQQAVLDELDSLAEALGDARCIVEARILRVNFHHARARWQDVLDLAGTTESQVQALGDSQLAVDMNISVAQALLRLGRLEEALQVGLASLEQAVSAGLLAAQPGILNGLGLVCTERFEREAAAGYFSRALELAREAGDLYIEAQALNNLGNLTAQTADYVSAREHYRAALDLAHRMGNRPGESLVLGNLGWVSALLGDFVSASSYQQQALQIARQVGNQYVVGNALINLSSLAGYLGQAGEALQYANQGLEVAAANNDRSGEAWACLFKGHAHLLAGDLQAARQDFTRSAAIRQELGQPNLRLEPLAGLVLSYLGDSRLQDALPVVDEILSAMATGITLDGTEEPLRVYYACYQALSGVGDARARDVLRDGYQALMESIAGIGDENTRRMVIENVPWRRALVQAWGSAE